MLHPTALVQKLEGKTVEELLRMAPRFARHELKLGAVRAYYWSTLHATSTARARRRRAAIERLRAADDVLFLCHGNICRSPFAERYARRRIEERGIDSLAFDSAGAIEMTDPHSPENARVAAEDHEIDLAEHRSIRTTAERIQDADLVLLMDYRNYHTYATRHPEAVDRMFLLRIFEPGREMRIVDPHGYDQSVFTSVYADIASCVETLLDEYEGAATEADQSTALSESLAEV